MVAESVCEAAAAERMTAIEETEVVTWREKV